MSAALAGRVDGKTRINVMIDCFTSWLVIAWIFLCWSISRCLVGQMDVFGKNGDPRYANKGPPDSMLACLFLSWIASRTTTLLVPFSDVSDDCWPNRLAFIATSSKESECLFLIAMFFVNRHLEENGF